jgi:hypothetical protein
VQPSLPRASATVSGQRPARWIACLLEVVSARRARRSPFGPTGPRTLGQETPLLGLEASQPFPPMRVIKVRSAVATEARPCSRAEVRCWAGAGPGGRLTPKGSEVTVRSTFPPSGGLCWASWRQSEKGGGEVYAESRSRGARGPATDQLGKGEIPGTHGGKTRDGRKSMRKVRTER